MQYLTLILTDFGKMKNPLSASIFLFVRERWRKVKSVESKVIHQMNASVTEAPRW